MIVSSVTGSVSEIYVEDYRRIRTIPNILHSTVCTYIIYLLCTVLVTQLMINTLKVNYYTKTVTNQQLYNSTSGLNCDISITILVISLCSDSSWYCYIMFLSFVVDVAFKSNLIIYPFEIALWNKDALCIWLNGALLLTGARRCNIIVQCLISIDVWPWNNKSGQTHLYVSSARYSWN